MTPILSLNTNFSHTWAAPLAGAFRRHPRAFLIRTPCAQPDGPARGSSLACIGAARRLA